MSHAYIHDSFKKNLGGLPFTIENYAADKIVWHWDDRTKENFFKSLSYVFLKDKEMNITPCLECLIIHMMKICFLRKWRAELNGRNRT